MKTVFILFTILTFSLAAHAQIKSITEQEVPASVKAEFAKAHPGAFEVSWKQTNSDYIAAYSYSTTRSYATYTEAGKLVESRDKITTFALPAPAYDYIKQNYPDASKEYFRITDSTGLVKFAAKVKDQEVLFDKKGVYLETVKIVL